MKAGQGQEQRHAAEQMERKKQEEMEIERRVRFEEEIRIKLDEIWRKSENLMIPNPYISLIIIMTVYTYFTSIVVTSVSFIL